MVDLESILADFRDGNADLEATLEAINGSFYQTLDDTTIDHDRQRRTGQAEVIYGAGKTPEQIAAAFEAIAGNGANVLATRVDAAAVEAVRAKVPDVSYSEPARLVSLVQVVPEPVETTVAVVTAGTSDKPVAEEAALTAEFYGNPVLRVSDVGVAGVHRLLNRVDDIRDARVVIAVAGMEGALPSVVAGLVDKPVIAVPTSVGYGAAFGGIAALLGMLTSCASGISVVNIDNGFGAGHLANIINRL